MNEKIELLHYYDEQWKYRNTHYWKLVGKDLYIGTAVILFPYLCERFEIVASSKLNPLFFSFFGVIISIAFCYLLLCESARIGKVKEKVDKLIVEIADENYLLSRVERIYRVPIAKIIPFVILAFHILLALVY